jgi:hypothetical protein
MYVFAVYNYFFPHCSSVNSSLEVSFQIALIFETVISTLSFIQTIYVNVGEIQKKMKNCLVICNISCNVILFVYDI